MKKILIFLFLGTLAGGLVAEDRPFAGYKTYSPNDIPVKLMPSPQVWKSLKTVRSLMKNETFQFLNRQDSDHWMGVTRVNSGVVVQIHDEDARFNFKALVNLTTGKITVQKGVDYLGHGREDDALYATDLALGYLERLHTNKVLYAEKKVQTPEAKSVKESAIKVKPEEKRAEIKKAEVMVNPGEKSLSPWDQLVLGNHRFVGGKALHSHQDLKRVAETAGGQHPFAIVVTCSDSRLSPEVLFDQGLGDLFVVRTAGEVTGPLELASIEYAVDHLHVTSLIVMGHKKCGAVDAAIQVGELSPDLQNLVEMIKPAVERAKDLKGDLLDNAVKENVKQSLTTIQSSEIVAKAVEEGKLKLVGAYYDIDNGMVSELK